MAPDQPGRQANRTSRRNNASQATTNPSQTPNTTQPQIPAQPDAFFTGAPPHPPTTPSNIRTLVGSEGRGPTDLSTLVNKLVEFVGGAFKRQSNSPKFFLTAEAHGDLQMLCNHIQIVTRQSSFKVMEKLAIMDQKIENLTTELGERLGNQSRSYAQVAASSPSRRHHQEQDEASQTFRTPGSRSRTTLAEEITLNQVEPNSPVFTDLSYPQLKAKIDEAIKDGQALSNGKPITVRAVSRLASKDIVITLHTEEQANILRSTNTWIRNLSPNLRMQIQKYSIICHRLPASFDPTSETDIQQLKKENSEIIAKSFVSVRWANPKAFQAEGPEAKKHSSIIIQLSSVHDANKAIRKSIVFDGKKRATEKSKRTVTQCHNCQHYGHTAARCTRQATCGRCAANHSTTQCNCPADSPCTSYKDCNHVTPKCALCEGPHRATSKTCPSYLKAKNAVDTINKAGNYLFPIEN